MQCLEDHFGVITKLVPRLLILMSCCYNDVTLSILLIKTHFKLMIRSDDEKVA